MHNFPSSFWQSDPSLTEIHIIVSDTLIKGDKHNSDCIVQEQNDELFFNPKI